MAELNSTSKTCESVSSTSGVSQNEELLLNEHHQDILEEIFSQAKVAKKRLQKMKEVMGDDYQPNNADTEFDKLVTFILSKGSYE
jgi:hypothetical protein